MQRFLKITLKGFKSFANKTEIPLEKGITCIAGANGSGKSNICDAFLFIFGKSSSKIMRAQRLEDLIFKGSETRRASEEALVEIEINNQDNVLPFEEEIIKIERKIGKEGVTSYRINGKLVSKQKVIEILRTLNIPPETHNIITQGEVTRILEMDAVERRKIIDELAGIAEFDEKKRKAEKELEKVEETLKEQKIILEEKEKLFQNITIEKKKVEEYNKLKKEIARLRYSIFINRLEEVKDKKKRDDRRLNEILTKKEEIEKEINLIENEIEKRENEIRELVSKVFSLQKEMPLMEKQEEIRRQILEKENKIEFNLREISRLKEFLEVIKISGISKPVKFILERKIEGVYGRVEDLIKPKEGYEVAISSLLQAKKNSLVVENLEVAIKCIELLKKNKIGFARFLPLKDLLEKECIEIKGEGILGNATKFAKYHKKFEKLAKYLLGNSLVGEKLEKVREYIGKYRIACLDGSLVERGGELIGGFIKKEEDRTKIYLENIKKLEEENKRLREELENLKKVYDEIKKEREKEKEGFSIFEEEKEKIEKEIDKLREKKRVFIERKLRLQNEESNLKIRIARYEVEIENLEKELEEIEKFDRVIRKPIKEMQNMIRELNLEIKKLGALNMKAIEEYEKLKEEYEFLKEKVEKILQEKYSILKVIDEIEKKRKDAFFKVFNAINEKFSEIYKELAEGEARLELEEKDNIYSGLLIKACPKGKKMLNIDSLSGGEKVIVALSLLFAIQFYKPSPIYILDEIDAALDKINTKRVIEIIKNFSKKSQFVIITHNETTMQYANVLYGCVMENGVSKIIGIKLIGNNYGSNKSY